MRVDTGLGQTVALATVPVPQASQPVSNVSTGGAAAFVYFGLKELFESQGGVL